MVLRSSTMVLPYAACNIKLIAWQSIFINSINYTFIYINILIFVVATKMGNNLFFILESAELSSLYFI